jgi:hypothetical protein
MPIGASIAPINTGGSVSRPPPRMHRVAPKPVSRNPRSNTNPIADGRVSGFAQSGFNEVAHRAKPDDHRRATSQNPPDSQDADFLIRCSEQEEARDGGSDWGSRRLHIGGFAAFGAALW